MTTGASSNNLYNDRDGFLTAARQMMLSCFESLTSDAITAEKTSALQGSLKPGKMLRSRLAWTLCPEDSTDVRAVVAAAAATELIHNATLFHDDIIDNAAMRRKKPALWQEIGSTGAILMGDLFFCTSLSLLSNASTTRNLKDFIARINEVCGTEVQHELAMRGAQLTVDQALAVARGKTGALFAFAAEAAAGDDEARREVFRQAGYAVGTAYQLADDLLDETGSEDELGKTLGTDRSRRKFTLAQSGGLAHDDLVQAIQELCRSAVASLAEWPGLAQRLQAYVDSDLLPAGILETSTTAS
jgi:geranylgeranyl pyrophosphate synthase